MAEYKFPQIEYELFRVHWVDSTSSYGWVLKSDLKDLDMNVYSIGFLIKSNDDYIVLSAHISSESFDAPICIPRVSIKSMEAVNG